MHTLLERVGGNPYQQRPSQPRRAAGAGFLSRLPGLAVASGLRVRGEKEVSASEEQKANVNQVRVGANGAVEGRSSC